MIMRRSISEETHKYPGIDTMGPVMLSAGSFRYGPMSMVKGNPGVTVAAGTLAVGFGPASDVVVTARLALALPLTGPITTVNVTP